MTVAGVDGCKSGWFVVLWRTDENRFTSRVVRDFAAVLAFAEAAGIIAIDIPVGLLDKALPGGRLCDVFARKLLHPNRMSSVFSAPVRGTLESSTYTEALTINRGSSHHDRGLSKQCFGILPKIREVDLLMSPDLQKRVREVHPELSFRSLNNGGTLSYPKHTLEGRTERLDLLVRNGFASFIAQTLGTRLKHAAPDDMLDACAACWSARQIAAGAASRIPPDPPRDARGLCMEMWY